MSEYTIAVYVTFSSAKLIFSVNLIFLKFLYFSDSVAQQTLISINFGEQR